MIIGRGVWFPDILYKVFVDSAFSRFVPTVASDEKANWDVFDLVTGYWHQVNDNRFDLPICVSAREVSKTVQFTCAVLGLR